MLVSFVSSSEIARQICDAAGAADGSSLSPDDIMAQALGDCSSLVDKLFASKLRGKGAHRLKEAKRLLRQSDPKVLQEMINFRRKNSFVHANALAQKYFLTEEWSVLHGPFLNRTEAESNFSGSSRCLFCFRRAFWNLGLEHSVGGVQMSAQAAFFNQAKTLILQSAVDWVRSPCSGVCLPSLVWFAAL